MTLTLASTQPAPTEQDEAQGATQVVNETIDLNRENGAVALRVMTLSPEAVREIEERLQRRAAPPTRTPRRIPTTDTSILRQEA